MEADDSVGAVAGTGVSQTGPVGDQAHPEDAVLDGGGRAQRAGAAPDVRDAVEDQGAGGDLGGAGVGIQAGQREDGGLGLGEPLRTREDGGDGDVTGVPEGETL